MPQQFYAYILASKPKGTPDTGVTSNLARRLWQHKQASVGRFVKEYGVHRLVYYEIPVPDTEAIQREGRLKEWNRAWKIQLILSRDPNWEDLSRTLMDTR